MIRLAVVAFLEAAKRLGVRDPEATDASAEAADAVINKAKLH